MKTKVTELNDEEKAIMKDVLASGVFTPREEKALLMWLGIEPFTQRFTVEELADFFKVSSGRMEQIMAKAYRKLRWLEKSL